MPKQILGRGQETGGCEVFVRDETREYELDARHDEVNHSPDGFQWGYRGSGPAQLAFAILAEVKNEDFAHEHYQDFKKDFVASIEGGEDFVISFGEVEEWAEVHA